MGEIIDFGAARNQRSYTSFTYLPEVIDESLDWESIYIDRHYAFLKLYRQENPDLFPDWFAEDNFLALRDRKYNEELGRMSEAESVFEEILCEKSAQEWESLEQTWITEEITLALIGQLDVTAESLEKIRQGDWGIPLDQQENLWASRYSRFLPNHENPFIS
jgi:hypothetical protein